MVEWLARHARRLGVRVAILSRGYGQTEGLNDEGRVLEDNLPDVPHLQGSDRAALARIAVEELESQLLLLDDGFQHRRLARNLDIVLIDALDPFGGGYLLPRGLLREPISSLRRADFVVLTRADLVDPATRTAIRTKLERQAGPLKWAEARHAPVDLLDAHAQVLALETLSPRRAIAFCGIGNPEGFRRTLEELNVPLVGFRVFADHHPYSRTDVDQLVSWTRETEADLVLTTQKDLVKLRLTRLGTAPLLAVRIGLVFLNGGETIQDALASICPPNPS
jgi:tetraacyldisaccharide 4'-kinase